MRHKSKKKKPADETDYDVRMPLFVVILPLIQGCQALSAHLTGQVGGLVQRDFPRLSRFDFFIGPKLYANRSLRI